MDSTQPHVRPFSSTTKFEGHAYICINNTKQCYEEMKKNSNIEITGMLPDGTWIRIVAQAIRDNRDATRTAILSTPTVPSQLHHLGNGIFEVLRLKDTVCTKYSLTAETEILQ